MYLAVKERVLFCKSQCDNTVNTLVIPTLSDTKHSLKSRKLIRNYAETLTLIFQESYALNIS